MGPEHPYRTHTCDQLRGEHVGQTVRLAGSVYRKREQKHHVFIDLRDHYGVTQLAFTEDNPETLAAARDVSTESIVMVGGEVVARGKANPNLATGEVELKVTYLTVDFPCAELPIYVQIPKGESDLDDEENRLRWRFLDLRRERLHRNITLRDTILRMMRDHMHSEGFLEVQTPILTNSSPEGARDYLVPSRLHPGQFYALPQAPQVWKQVLMASGFDRYFQIAPCFRDEDARADRSPGEFYQLDMEMAFAEQEDVFGVIERMYKHITERSQEIPGMPGKRVQEYPFPRLKYWDVIDRYGSDKPDLRFGLEIQDVTDLLGDSTFPPFAQAIESGGRVKALRIPGLVKENKAYARKLEKHAKGKGFAGLPHLLFKAEGLDGSIKKFMEGQPAAAALQERLGCQEGDLLVFGQGERERAAAVLGEVRVKVGRDRAEGVSATDVTEVFKKTKYEPFAGEIARGGAVRALIVRAGVETDYAARLEEYAQQTGLEAATTLVFRKQGFEGGVSESLHPKELQRLREQVQKRCGDGDLVLLAAGPRDALTDRVTSVHSRVADDRDFPNPDQMAFLFVVDYPFYELDEEQDQIQFSHNPFSMPQGGLEALNSKEPLEILAYQYDIVCNGIELSSGAIRNHRPDTMYRAFEIAGYSQEDVDKEFGHMIRAFCRGTPPHGGMAPGVERTIMLYLDEPNIREVVAFPKNQKCQDLLANAPSEVRPEQLEELHIRIVAPPE